MLYYMNEVYEFRFSAFMLVPLSLASVKINIVMTRVPSYSSIQYVVVRKCQYGVLEVHTLWFW
jgi:hypothetical protein